MSMQSFEKLGQEAQALANALLAERAEAFITGTGQAIGLPDLRPGDNVEMRGLGVRFNGPYYVTKVEHVINESASVASRRKIARKLHNTRALKSTQCTTKRCACTV